MPHTRKRGEDKSDAREDKKDAREEKVDSRRGYRLDKIKALTAKATAVAKKRKWLVFMIGLGLVAYVVISKGGFGGMGGILETIKNFF
ncbi:hypothetical protein CMI37_02985 [Candidatus Pacearchaeota archaeon]|nr:hypothetical protein [Candidatus Pacearchaeota archaeon]|tara:strand:- start:12520 stop:12783 length:264 start_codon:yes stop_codon:yes gene_type:complete